MDEWLVGRCRGNINASAVDETKTSQKRARADKTFAVQLIEKARGKYEAQLNVVQQSRHGDRVEEETLKEGIEVLTNHDRMDEFEGLPAPYTDGQRSSLGEINNAFAALARSTKSSERQISGARNGQGAPRFSSRKKGDGNEMRRRRRLQDGRQELNTIRQMAKLCVGRQGNHFPILMKQYFRGRKRSAQEKTCSIPSPMSNTRSGMFLRTFKQQTNRIVPNVVLMPCYGDQGVCWEPFERYNRSTSRGRLAIPMYAKTARCRSRGAW